jgi:hypothetical protein
MKKVLQAISSPVGRVLDGVRGLCGGWVVAFVVCLPSVYLHRVWPFSGRLLVGWCGLVIMAFSAAGLLRSRYFGLFFAPLFSMLAGDGATYQSGEITLKQFLLLLSLPVALLTLLVGTLFVAHVAVAIGSFLFVHYAIRAPRSLDCPPIIR